MLLGERVESMASQPLERLIGLGSQATALSGLDEVTKRHWAQALDWGDFPSQKTSR